MFSRCRRRRVRTDFSGGLISSNGGALLLREMERKLGLMEKVCRTLGDLRQRGKVRHEVLSMLCQRVHALALGYEDLNDHHSLATTLPDPGAEKLLASNTTTRRK